MAQVIKIQNNLDIWLILRNLGTLESVLGDFN